MIRAVLLATGGLWAATGGAIFVDPRSFYDLTPGVAMMGPYNLHFIRDVGLGFLASGVITAAGAWRHDRRLVLAGSFWPFLHALFHIQIWSHRGFPLDAIAAFDAIAVIVPPWLAVALAWRYSLHRGEIGP